MGPEAKKVRKILSKLKEEQLFKQKASEEHAGNNNKYQHEIGIFGKKELFNTNHIFLI